MLNGFELRNNYPQKLIFNKVLTNTFTSYNQIMNFYATKTQKFRYSINVIKNIIKTKYDIF